MRPIGLFVCCAVLALAPAAPPLRAAGTGSIRLTIRPEMLLADGHSTATVVAEVRDSGGDRVPDGTAVRFTTTAGAIEGVVLASAGTARATFTSATLPDTAQISAFAAGASATARLSMVSELPDLRTGSKVVRVTGKYVAYSENLRVLEATDTARVNFRGLEVSAQRLQIDLNMDVLKAQGGVRIKGKKRELTGERLFLTLRTLQGVLLGLEGRHDFAGVDLLEQQGTSNRRPATGDRRPTTNDQRPTTAEEPSPATDRPPPTADVGGSKGEGPGPKADSGTPSAQPPSPGTQPAAPSTESPAPGTQPSTPSTVPPTVNAQPSAPSTEHRAPGTEHPATAQRPPIPDFALVDLSESDMLWTARRATAILGDRVQLHGATAYWVGARLLPLGNHEIPLDGSAVGTDRYVGVGSTGLVVDLPYYFSLGAGGSTALRLRHSDRNGFGYFSQRPGWQLDLERKYGEPGGVEGLFSLNRITGSDWGLRWSHNQPLGPTTRLYSFFDYPAHRDAYGQINLNKQWGFATTTLSLSGTKFQDRPFGHTVDFGAESRPWSIGTGFKLSLEGRAQDSRGGELVQLNGHRVQVPGITQQQFGIRLRPPTLRLGPSSSLSTSLTTREAWGYQAGPGLAASASFAQKLGGNNALTLNYNYNQIPGYAYLRTSGGQNLSATLFFSPGKRFRLNAFGLMGLDNPIRSLTGAASYAFTPSWRLDLQHTFYQFGFFNDTDTQIGIARALGQRELFFYWSTVRHRLAIEVGVNNF